MEPFEKVLESIPTVVCFGVTTIRVFRASELRSHQLGYSVSPTGASLTGDKDGDWLRKWVVIGYEDACGDPVFIDTSFEGFPVYTAAHGEGRWDPKQIAVSLVEFGRTLSTVAELSKGRENAVALQNDPLTQSEKDTILAAIRRGNPSVGLEFWDILLSV